jgi:multiple antibiotic resistance protein
MDVAFAAKFMGAMFAIMNPFINLPIFLALTTDKTVPQQRSMAQMILLYASVTCAVIALAGSTIIGFFGITVDAFRTAGGLVLLGIAFSMLNGQPITSHERGEHEKRAERSADSTADDNVAFYPMTFPIIVGPGTIATLIIYAAQLHKPAQYISYGIVLLAILLALFVVLFFAAALGEILSAKMRVIMTRLMGMILAAIAIEMVFAGAKAMLPGLA